MLSTLIFDLDNTIVHRDVAMRKAMEEYSDSLATVDEIMRKDDSGFAERGEFCNWLMERLKINEEPDRLLQTIQGKIINYLEPDEEINKMLRNLKDHFWLVLGSNGRSEVQRGKLRKAGLEKYFSHVFISGEMNCRKPDALYFETILKTLEIRAEEAMMIGDNIINDIQGAQACGLSTCWVTNKKELKGNVKPDIILSSVNELEQWLKHQICRQ